MGNYVQPDFDTKKNSQITVQTGINALIPGPAHAGNHREPDYRKPTIVPTPGTATKNPIALTWPLPAYVQPSNNPPTVTWLKGPMGTSNNPH